MSDEDFKDKEIVFLRKLLKAYEKISQLSGAELSEAEQTILAYETVSKLARSELLSISSSIETIKARQNTLTEEIIKILDQDISSDKSILQNLEELSKNSPENFYSDLFYVITNLELPEEEAKKIWEEILLHTSDLSAKLNRPVSFRVGLLDYVLEKNRVIKNPKIIELHFFDSIVKNSVVDELTNIYNRRYFNLAYRRELKRAKRYARPISLFVFDIDNFKKLNDTYGHSKGDDALRLIGEILKDSFRVEDTLCRVGGEEFAVILPEISVEAAMAPCKRFAEKLKISSKEKLNIEITISAGLSQYPENGETLEELYAKADTALYKVKNSGKDNIICFKEF
jgi:two-component system, cell cycle response regulator